MVRDVGSAYTYLVMLSLIVEKTEDKGSDRSLLLMPQCLVVGSAYVSCMKPGIAAPIMSTNTSFSNTVTVSLRNKHDVLACSSTP